MKVDPPAPSERVAVVTGGAQGIGLEIARELARQGNAVAIADVQVEPGERAAQEIRDLGARAAFVAADVGRADAIGAMVEACVRRLGGLHILINNAAPERTRRAPFLEQGDEEWDRAQRLMLTGYMLSARAAARHFASDGGCIVNLSSVLARSISHESAAYHVAKAGVEHLTRYLAHELGPLGIRVNAVAPGIVDRDHGRKLTDDPVNRKVAEAVVPLRRAARAEEIASVVAFLCSRGASYLTGQTIIVDGGLSLAEPFGAARRALECLSGGP